MKMLKFGVVAIAVAMSAASPVLAAGAVNKSSAAPTLGVRGAVVSRAAAPVDADANRLTGGSWLLAALAAAAVIAGIVVAVDGGNDNEGPVSA